MSGKRMLLAFIAGFVATLAFHQGGLALLNAAGLTDRAPFGTVATRPFGVPAVVSLAFWGGIWGIVLALVVRQRTQIGAYLLRAALFGALLPTAVALLVVAPLKNMPIAAGGDPKLIAGGLILNGLWGLGTALLLHLMVRQLPAPSP